SHVDRVQNATDRWDRIDLESRPAFRFAATGHSGPPVAARYLLCENEFVELDVASVCTTQAYRHGGRAQRLYRRRVARREEKIVLVAGAPVPVFRGASRRLF